MGDAVDIREIAKRAKNAAAALVAAPASRKNMALTTAGELLVGKAADEVLKANEMDLTAARDRDLSAAMIDRLALNPERLAGIASALNQVAALPDPVGSIENMVTRPSGISVGKMRIPLGVIAMIYESRPNVTADAGGLCLKAGNAVILRGGSEAIHSNTAIAKVMGQACEAAGLPADSVLLIENTDRALMTDLLKQEDLIDLVIPRGGEGLIRFVAENSRIPVLKHYKGVCHIFVDESADFDSAINVILNAKTQRPGVCNALETLLVHEAVASEFLPKAAKALHEKSVTLFGCEKTRNFVPDAEEASEKDWEAEYLDLILAVRVVDGLDAAMEHIRKYSSRHTESILTNDHANAMRFLREVDSSSVMVNASTRFADGGEYGLGAEIGISTSKLHAFGPMGLLELTTTKFVVFGQGQVRT